MLDSHLANARYLAGETYTIADMALWGWACSAGYVFREKGLGAYPNVSRLIAEINESSAAQRALAVKTANTADTVFDDHARAIMFPQNLDTDTAGQTAA